MDALSAVANTGSKLPRTYLVAGWGAFGTSDSLDTKLGSRSRQAWSMRGHVVQYHRRLLLSCLLDHSSTHDVSQMYQRLDQGRPVLIRLGCSNIQPSVLRGRPIADTS